MGVQMSTIKNILRKQHFGKPCYPITPYVSIDKDEWPTTNENGLVLDVQILPDKLRRGVDDGSWFWWCDAQFVPFRDDQLFATSSSFLPRVSYTWVSVPTGTQQGRVQLMSLADPQNLRTSIYSRTNSSVFPKVQPHPLGKLVAYCGTGEIVIMSTDGDPVYQRSRDLINAVHVYCAVAPNGLSLAVIKRGMGVYFLETCYLDAQLMGSESVRIHQDVCPGFVPQRRTSDFVACKFSPDSKFIAVGSLSGFLFVVTLSRLQKHLIICPEMTEQFLSAAEAFDFNPRFSHESMALGTRDDKLHLLNIDTAELELTVDVEETIDCLRYSPDGLHLAAGLRNFDLRVYDGRNLNLFHSISMAELYQGEVRRVQPHVPAVVNLSYSQDCGHIASSSCDGRLRIWRLPRMHTLKELCRHAVLRSVPIRQVEQLKMVPCSVRDFLMYKYF